MAPEHKHIDPSKGKRYDSSLLPCFDPDAPSARGNSWYHVACVLWAVFLGASVTMRLKASMHLSAVGNSPVINAYCVVAIVDLMSALCLMPFVSNEKLPRHRGPWLSALCLIPSASLIAASRMLGQCLVQVMLKLSTMLGALAVDVVLEKRQPDTRRVLGIIVVIVGVVFISLGGTAGSGAPSVSAFIMGLAAALASGVGYVMSARCLAPAGGADATSTAFVAFLAIAILELPSLVIANSQNTGFHVEGRDLPIWILIVAQSLFYTRSLQFLPKQIGYTATFTFCLAAQLLTAAIFHHTKDICDQIIGLSLVFFGAALSEFSST